jgi:hypothetical protein
MNIREQILEGLEEQMILEVAARDAYASLVGAVDDGRVKTVVSKIVEDEIDHINILNELIKIVKDYPKHIGETGVGTIRSPLDSAFSEGNAFLLVSTLDRYMIDIVSSLKQLQNRRVLYVSYNKIPKYTKKVLADFGIGLDNTLFISCVEMETHDDINVSPTDLTKLSITISDSMDILGADGVILIDSLFGFSTYHNENTITRFVGIINNKARDKEHKVIWVALNEPGENVLNNKVSQLCDRTIRTV